MSKILMVHLLALVILGIQEMGLIVKVSSGYFKWWYEKSRNFFSHCKTHIAGIYLISHVHTYPYMKDVLGIGFFLKFLPAFLSFGPNL